MGLIAQVLWQALPELLHVGALLVCLAVLLALMGNALFGGRAQSFSTLTGMFTVLLQIDRHVHIQEECHVCLDVHALASARDTQCKMHLSL